MLEYFGAVTGLIYLFLEIKQHRAMWLVGIFSSLVYVYVFFDSKVYATMGLYVYYVLISVYGFLQWNRQKQETGGETGGEPAAQGRIVYSHLTRKLAGIILPLLVLINILICYILSRYTDSAVPVIDSVITAIGIVATWMLARRIIEHWICWIAANALAVYMYYTLAMYPTMILFACYTLLAFAGYYTWKKKGADKC
jgi:nicotinamide mononucleotide transporter